MFVEKHDIPDHLAWTPATSRVSQAILARETLRYNATRRDDIVFLVLSLAFCVLLLAVTGESLANLWPVLLFFAVFWAIAIRRVLRARAVLRCLRLTSLDTAPCLCVSKEQVRRNKRNVRSGLHIYDYRVTIEYARDAGDPEDARTALWTDPETFARFHEQSRALLLRLQYKGRTYYDVVP